MTRRPFIRREQLARRAHLDDQLVKDLFDVILACMEEDTAVQIDGFGVFVPVRRAPGIARSPLVNGGKPYQTRGGRSMRLRVSPTLRKTWSNR